MKYKPALFLIVLMAPVFFCLTLSAQMPDDLTISPSRPVPTGKAPDMEVKQIKDSPEEKVYAITCINSRRRITPHIDQNASRKRRRRSVPG